MGIIRAKGGKETPARRKAVLSRALQAFSSALDADEKLLVPRREFKAPDLPPGVVPQGKRAFLATDNALQQGYGWLNTQGGGVACGMGFPGYAYLSQLAQRSEYRSPSEVIANELTRRWMVLTGCTPKEEEELTEAIRQFRIRDFLHDAALIDGLQGAAHLVPDIKGQDTDPTRELPLLLDETGKTVAKGSLLGFKLIEPMWATPLNFNSNNPFGPDFYKPVAWYFLGKKVHATRVMTFISRPLPDMLKPAYNFGGMSLSQLIEAYVNRWLKTVDSVNRMISQYSTSGVKTNLMAMLTEDDTAASLVKRVQTFTRLRDNRGILMLDKEAEDFFQYNVPLSGLSELQAQAQEHMAAPTHIPLVKLTGITPAGLNANSDGEIRVFYDWIASEQINLFDPHMPNILKLIQLHLWGKVNPKIGYQWVPLHAPTEAELAEILVKEASTGQGYISTGVVSPDEERDRLRKRRGSGYEHLIGDAPEPPEPLDETDGEGGGKKPGGKSGGGGKDK
jgi:hypothetical protein